MNHPSFSGKVALITGAAQGIGKQVAMDLARGGANVVISDIEKQLIGEAVREIEAEGGVGTGVLCDVSSRDQVENMVQTAVDTYGSADILINNAGLLRTGTIEELDDNLLDATIDINVKGVIYGIQAVTPYMKKKRYGRIINVSSITGKRGDGSTTFVYGASKGAVISLTRSAARELGPFGITVNAIAPHAVMTKLMDYWDEKRKQDAIAKIPVGRLGTVEDMSHLMMFLASDKSSFITGECININGGYYMD